MSKRTWTGEELQQQLDEWEARLNAGEKLPVSLVIRSAPLPLFPSMDHMLIYNNEQIAVLTDAQAKAVEFWLQRMYCQQQEPAMSAPRDTQFAGFAQLLWEEFLDKTAEDFARIGRGEDWIPDSEYITLIAQRTYDLLKNGMKYLHDYVPDISDIPDMTAWPKDGEE